MSKLDTHSVAGDATGDPRPPDTHARRVGVQERQDPPRQLKQAHVRPLNVWAIAGEVGVIIALPLVLLVLLGIKIDKVLGTTPLFIIIGMVLAMVISAISIARKVKRLTV